jgi:hypothetical protein
VNSPEGQKVLPKTLPQASAVIVPVVSSHDPVTFHACKPVLKILAIMVISVFIRPTTGRC